MQTRLPLSLLWLGLSVMFAAACSDDASSCEPGEEIDCTCADGSEGTRYCLSNARFDQCYCGGFDPDSFTDLDDVDRPDTRPPTRDAGSPLDPLAPFFDAGRDAGADAGLDASLPADGVLLAAGLDPLLELFAQGENVWLVQSTGISRLSLLDGGMQARWGSPRPLTGAVFDGERLVALDGAKLTWLEQTDLSAVASSFLVEPCQTAALLSGGPLICGNSNSTFQATLSAIDVADGGQSARLQANRSGELYAVPGTQRFMQVETSGSSVVPQVYELAADGGLAAVTDAGFGLSTSVSFQPPLAFDADPAENVVTRQGILMRANASCGTTSEPCLTRTGTLGVLAGQEVFLGMSSVDGELVGLVDPSSSALSSPGTRCASVACRLLRVDVAKREIVGQVTLRRPLRSVLGMHAVPEQKALVVALTPPGERVSSSTLNSGFEVVRFELP
ncbi:MAG TPA: hypothetical protein VFZ61_01345 [Polyangiales bacterium]